MPIQGKPVAIVLRAGWEPVRKMAAPPHIAKVQLLPSLYVRFIDFAFKINTERNKLSLASVSLLS